MVNARGRATGVSDGSCSPAPEDRALRYASRELSNYWQEHPRPTAASMPGSYQVRRKAQAGSNLGREQARPPERAIRTGSGRTVRISVRRKAA